MKAALLFFIVLASTFAENTVKQTKIRKLYDEVLKRSAQLNSFIQDKDRDKSSRQMRNANDIYDIYHYRYVDPLLTLINVKKKAQLSDLTDDQRYFLNLFIKEVDNLLKGEDFVDDEQMAKLIEDLKYFRDLVGGGNSSRFPFKEQCISEDGRIY